MNDVSLTAPLPEQSVPAQSVAARPAPATDRILALLPFLRWWPMVNAVTLKGDLKKLALGGWARIPGGETLLTGAATPMATGPARVPASAGGRSTGARPPVTAAGLPAIPVRAWVSLGTRLAKLEELLGMLPAHLRQRIEALKPAADVRLALNLGYEPGRAIVEQTFEMAAARATVTTREPSGVTAKTSPCKERSRISDFNPVSRSQIIMLLFSATVTALAPSDEMTISSRRGTALPLR